MRARWQGGVVALAVLFWGVLGAWSPAEGAEAAQKIGFVDMQQILAQSKRGMVARAKLEAETAAKQKEVSARQEELKKLQTDFEKQMPVLSESARKEKEEVLRRRFRDFQRLTEDSNRDLAKRESELVGELQKEISGVVRDYGREKGYTIILERQLAGILYGADQADLTKEILERYNATQK